MEIAYYIMHSLKSRHIVQPEFDGRDAIDSDTLYSEELTALDPTCRT